MHMPVALPRQLSRLPAPNRWVWAVAQDLVRVGIELKRMRHYGKVNTGAGKWQVVHIRQDIDPSVGTRVIPIEPQRHAVGAQKVVRRQ